MSAIEGLADSASYVARPTAKPRGIDATTSPRALMADAKIAEGLAPHETERPAALPVIPPAVVQENLRRVKAGASNTLVTILPDGKRMYREDRVVRETDGVQDTTTHGQRTDRGEGTIDSLSMLTKEGEVKIDRLLLRPKPSRDTRGRFVVDS